jgi:hypothetical protein
MVSILGMNQVQAVPPDELLRLITEEFRGGSASVEYLSLSVDQRDCIGAVIDQRSKALESCGHGRLPFCGSENLY